MAKTKTTTRKRVKPADKPFGCHCGTRFLKRAYLNAHIRRFHSGGDIPAATTSEQIPEKCETEAFSYSDEDWTDPDISLEEPVTQSESSSELKESDIKDCDSIEKDLAVSDSDLEEVQNEEDDKKTNSPSDIKTEEECKDAAEISSGVQQEERIKKTEFVQKQKEKSGEVEDDTREIRNIYEGRLYSKPTVPMRVMAPKRQTTLVSREKDDDVDEIELKLKDSRKKRLVLKCPCGKKLKLDIQLE